VWTIDSPEGVAYRGALQFEEPCELFWETGTLYESHVPVDFLDRAEGGERRLQRGD